MARRFRGYSQAPEPPPVRTVEPKQMGERRFRIRKPGDTSYLMVAYRTPELTHPDTYALDVLGMIPGHARRRVYQALVEGKLASEVEAVNETARDPFHRAGHGRSGRSLPRVEEALFREVERAKSDPATPEEIARAKKQLQASFVYSKDSIRSLARQLGYYETVATHTYLTPTWIESTR
jgi:zinc protease